jgi:hypothetical protein
VYKLSLLLFSVGHRVKTHRITTPAQAEKAEGNRLLTYLYFSTSKWIGENPGQGKDAKAPESAEMPENPTDDEE